MRIATCINSLQLTLTGVKGSVSIGKGWTGDVDQVLGEQAIRAKVDPEDPTKVLEPERRVDVTIADMLGHHFTEANFTVAAPPTVKGPKATSPAAGPPKE